MTDEKWFKLFDETSETFKWFIVQYFGLSLWNILMEERIKEDRTKMSITMNNIWFELPDGKFNIIENPKGWNEFLNLIEE